VGRLFKVERANDAIVELVAEVVPVTRSIRLSRGAPATLTFAPSHPSLKRLWSQQRCRLGRDARPVQARKEPMPCWSIP